MATLLRRRRAGERRRRAMRAATAHGQRCLAGHAQAAAAAASMAALRRGRRTTHRRRRCSDGGGRRERGQRAIGAWPATGNTPTRAGRWCKGGSARRGRSGGARPAAGGVRRDDARATHSRSIAGIPFFFFFFLIFFRFGVKGYQTLLGGSPTLIGASSNWCRSLELGVRVWSPTK